MLICNRIILVHKVEYRFEEMSFICFLIDENLTNSSPKSINKKDAYFCGYETFFRNLSIKQIMRCEKITFVK
jgi:hypothetical protein